MKCSRKEKAQLTNVEVVGLKLYIDMRKKITTRVLENFYTSISSIRRLSADSSYLNVLGEKPLEKRFLAVHVNDSQLINLAAFSRTIKIYLLN